MTDVTLAAAETNRAPAGAPATGARLRVVAVALPVGLAAILLLGASLWLWARFGLGVYVDAALSALAACL